MSDKEQIVKTLTAKDENKACLAAREIVNNSDVEAFQLLVQKSDFLFDFVKNNVNKRLQKAINEKNFRNLFAFLKVYSVDFEDTIAGSLARYANEDLTDEILELFENGTDDEKAKLYAELLYNQALLIAGLQIEDPSAYANLVCKLMK